MLCLFYTTPQTKDKGNEELGVGVEGCTSSPYCQLKGWHTAGVLFPQPHNRLGKKLVLATVEMGLVNLSWVARTEDFLFVY